ncbi:MAG: hypothetical protein JO023_18330 [Chloroflexi bacterium]|nr:hypothetical protein [Chloroflexota bacterium]
MPDHLVVVRAGLGVQGVVVELGDTLDPAVLFVDGLIGRVATAPVRQPPSSSGSSSRSSRLRSERRLQRVAPLPG